MLLVLLRDVETLIVTGSTLRHGDSDVTGPAVRCTETVFWFSEMWMDTVHMLWFLAGQTENFISTIVYITNPTAYKA